MLAFPLFRFIVMRIKTVLFLFIALLYSTSAFASDAKFFRNINGKWSGPGEIVAGKFKGTKFVCTFGGSNPASSKSGMDVNGTCRVGVFNQKMNAKIVKTAGKYIGKFLDGAKGDGMDVTGGRYTRNRLVVDIKRKDLNGVLVANLNDPNNLKVTVLVKHGKKLIPVIGMNLARQGGTTLSRSSY